MQCCGAGADPSYSEKLRFSLYFFNGNGIFNDLFTLKKYINRRFHHRRRLGSHILIRYILYFLDALQKIAK